MSGKKPHDDDQPKHMSETAQLCLAIFAKY